MHIKDDNQFAYMLEEFSKIENDPRARMALGGGISIASSSGRNETNHSAGEEEEDYDERLTMRGKSKDVLEKKAKQQSIAAWFVTREIVQGESRHAKLLAKGLRVSNQPKVFLVVLTWCKDCEGGSCQQIQRQGWHIHPCVTVQPNEYWSYF